MSKYYLVHVFFFFFSYSDYNICVLSRGLNLTIETETSPRIYKFEFSTGWFDQINSSSFTDQCLSLNRDQIDRLLQLLCFLCSCNNALEVDRVRHTCHLILVSAHGLLAVSTSRNYSLQPLAILLTTHNPPSREKKKKKMVVMIGMSGCVAR